MEIKLQKKNIGKYIFLSLITYGIYYPCWFWKQKDALNSLNSKEKINNIPYIFIIVVFSLSLILLIPSLIYSETQFGDSIDKIDRLLNLLATTAILIESFKVKRILNEHYHIYLKKNIKFSFFATLFFNFFYLQFKINKIEEDN